MTFKEFTTIYNDLIMIAGFTIKLSKYRNREITKILMREHDRLASLLGGGYFNDCCFILPEDATPMAAYKIYLQKHPKP